MYIGFIILQYIVICPICGTNKESVKVLIQLLSPVDATSSLTLWDLARTSKLYINWYETSKEHQGTRKGGDKL